MGEVQAAARHQQQVEELCVAAVRALAGRRDLHFRGGRLHRGRQRLPLWAPHLHPKLERDDFGSFRGAADGLGLRLPIIATDLGTFDTASAAATARGRVTVTSRRKIDTALALMDRHVDTADLLAQLAIPIPTVTTPQMFEFQLLERARADRKRIVLPEGDDDRILGAAGRLLRREVADLTILGDEAAIRACNRQSVMRLPEKPMLFLEFHGSEASVADQLSLVRLFGEGNGGGQLQFATATEDRKTAGQTTSISIK